MNLMGLIVIFPGGANLAGNMSVTLVLAVCTFVVVNFSGRKGYWKDIFWPEVPTWLKCPVPMMPVIEIFGVFTKPIALMIRLFANMLGGHLITLVLISLIFIFAAKMCIRDRNGTVSAAGKCNIVIEVKVTSEGQGVNFVGLNVTVDFTGDRLAADKSSEALIKEFIFNSDSISDVIIADKTIEFYRCV